MPTDKDLLHTVVHLLGTAEQLLKVRGRASDDEYCDDAIPLLMLIQLTIAERLIPRGDVWIQSELSNAAGRARARRHEMASAYVARGINHPEGFGLLSRSETAEGLITTVARMIKQGMPIHEAAQRAVRAWRDTCPQAFSGAPVLADAVQSVDGMVKSGDDEETIVHRAFEAAAGHKFNRKLLLGFLDKRVTRGAKGAGASTRPG
jgi:hypothetical protein